MTKVVEALAKPVHPRSTALMMVIIAVTSVCFIGGCELLSAVIHSAAGNYREAAVKKALLDLSVIELAVDAYAIEHRGRYPASLEEIGPVRGLTGKGCTLLDPWGTPYKYEPAANSSEVRLYSLGSDGQIGGTGLAADLDLSDLERLRSQVSR